MPGDCGPVSGPSEIRDLVTGKVRVDGGDRVKILVDRLQNDLTLARPVEEQSRPRSSNGPSGGVKAAIEPRAAATVSPVSFGVE